MKRPDRLRAGFGVYCCSWIHGYTRGSGARRRLDQTLANLYLLELPALEGLDVCLDDGREEVFIIRGRAEIIGQPGDTVSLLAMDDCVRGVLTDGLRYPLKEETLYQNRSRGISNEMLAKAATVQVSSGRLLCIHTRRDLPAEE